MVALGCAFEHLYSSARVSVQRATLVPAVGSLCFVASSTWIFVESSSNKLEFICFLAILGLDRWDGLSHEQPDSVMSVVTENRKRLLQAALWEPQKRQRRNSGPKVNSAAAKDTSVDAAVVVVLSKVDGIIRFPVENVVLLYSALDATASTGSKKSVWTSVSLSSICFMFV